MYILSKMKQNICYTFSKVIGTNSVFNYTYICPFTDARKTEEERRQMIFSILHSTQNSKTNDTSFESPNIKLLESGKELDINF